MNTCQWKSFTVTLCIEPLMKWTPRNTIPTKERHMFLSNMPCRGCKTELSSQHVFLRHALKQHNIATSISYRILVYHAWQPAKAQCQNHPHWPQALFSLPQHEPLTLKLSITPLTPARQPPLLHPLQQKPLTITQTTTSLRVGSLMTPLLFSYKTSMLANTSSSQDTQESHIINTIYLQIGVCLP